MYFVHKLTVLNYLLLYLKAGVVTRMQCLSALGVDAAWRSAKEDQTDSRSTTLNW